MNWMRGGRAGSRSSSPRRKGRTSPTSTASIRRLLPRRHRRDGRPAPPDGRRVDAIAGRPRRGLTSMLPTEDAIWVGDELQPALRPPRVAVRADRHRREPVRDPACPRDDRPPARSSSFNWCYHGTVDETSSRSTPTAASSRAGQRRAGGRPRGHDSRRRVQRSRRRSSAHSPTATSPACLTEPALTNIGIVLPERGYHEGARASSPAAGTLLVIDETHTICAGPGGYTAAWDLEPDLRHDRQADRRRHPDAPPTA